MYRLLAVAVFVAALASTVIARQDPASTPPAAPPFDQWLAELRAEALAKGISAATVDAAFATIEAPNPVVVARDRAQPEQVQTLDGYVARRLVPRTIRSAREFATKHRTVLQRVSTKYDISRSMLVSVWALESNFGRFTGTYPTVAALATLAYDPRRAALFRRELFEALTILDKGVIAVDEMRGSWAGAMGQPQFMPSSYLRYAVDFDEDGRADIWKSEADVFASIANYLKTVGWESDERWGREVRISQAVMDRIDRDVPMRTAGCSAIRQMTVARPLTAWSKLGVKLADGRALPAATLEASLVRGNKRHFLVYRNYLTILDYNCSHSYAVAVGLLADRLGS